MRTRLSALICVGAFALTGCGSDLGPDLHPGSAAVVGDQRISVDEVDDLSGMLCGFYGVVAGSPGSVGMVRAQVLDAKVQEAQAEAYAEEFDVDPRPYVRLQENDLESQIDQLELTGSQKDALRDFVRSGIYAQSVQMAVGMGDRPMPPPQQRAQALQAAAATGAETIQKWTESLELTKDPRYLEFGESGIKLDPSPLSISAANPEGAEVAQEELQAAVAALPASQKCE